MMRRHTRQSAREWTAIQLGCAAAVLLALAAVFLSHVHHRQMQTVREQAAQTRAQLMAQSIGQRLAHAAAAGIPLDQLVGVPEFLDRWNRSHPEVTRIAVHDLQDRLLWISHAQTAAPAPDISTGSADVAPAGVAQARVHVQLHNGSLQGLDERLALLVPAVLLVSALAYLGALFACAPGPWLRNHGVRMITRWAARGDYRRLLVLPQRKSFDLRVQEVAHAMRRVHERVTRMRLLIGSLRRTEPQQLRRDYLDQVLLQIEGQDRFADAEPAVVRLVAVQVHSLWMSLLLCLGAIAPLTYALRGLAPTGDSPGSWQQALPAACLSLLVLAAAAGWTLAARLRMATLSLLILGLAALLLAPLAMLLDNPPHPGWIAAWNGAFAGAALAACTRAQTHPDAHPGFAHAQPGMPGAALLAWWGGLLWLAPALGYYAHAALRPAWAVPALLLPMLCGLFFATRWDVAHSPWRVRMAAAARARAAAWRWAALGLAAGLVAGPLLPGLVLSGPAAPPALLQQCALGIGMALVWSWHAGPGPRGRAPALRSPWRRRARRLVMLALLAAVAPLPWPGAIEWLQPLLQGVLLGLQLAKGLAQAAQAPQHATSLRLLLGAALGIGLSAVAIVLGLQGWLPLLALLLLALPAATPSRGAHVA
ncbi:hypothetical protein [Acidovorax sp. CCYZU-2555]|uniref:hypothetical protein n=1 Tax=Acidovorax sp. CCYZU-2555 TaxID=2835042 RepID=UPI001BCDE407|nr:hypothetical protein [Acidovorax sp. CCYZU-2555]MBS7777614.1 hypothetical protein [Acidovorax sp. CCYZU-2555]